MNKKAIKLLFSIITICLVVLFTSNVQAANLIVQVNCDGKTIHMTSETPNMTWSINNLLPGEKDESTLTIENVGKKDVDVDLKAVVEGDSSLAEILNITVEKIKENNETEVIYSGKYSEQTGTNLSVATGKNITYKITTSMPREAGNEYQEKECSVKLNLVASGDEDEPETPEEPEDPEEPVDPEEPEDPVVPDEPETPEEPEEPVEPETPVKPEEPSKPDEPKKIITDKVEPVQTGESKTIYIVAGVLCAAVMILGITLIFGKGKNKKVEKSKEK